MYSKCDMQSEFSKSAKVTDQIGLADFISKNLKWKNRSVLVSLNCGRVFYVNRVFPTLHLLATLPNILGNPGSATDKYLCLCFLNFFSKLFTYSCTFSLMFRKTSMIGRQVSELIFVSGTTALFILE